MLERLVADAFVLHAFQNRCRRRRRHREHAPSSFWLPAAMRPRHSLERIAKAIGRRHHRSCAGAAALAGLEVAR